MMIRKHPMRLAAMASLMTLASLGGVVKAQPAAGGDRAMDARPATGGAPTSRHEAAANKHVDDAVAIVHRMEMEPHMRMALQQAKGVFIVPAYGRVALGVGASGGTGVLLVRRENNMWSDPVFYNIGGLNVGAQAGAEGGPIAMVLNNEKAVNAFMQKNNFALSADAGLTVVNWAKMAQSTLGSGDVLAWTGTQGLFGDVVTIGINDVRFNENLSDAYYHATMSARDIITGSRRNPQANALKNALAAAAVDTRASGSSGKGMENGASGSGKK